MSKSSKILKGFLAIAWMFFFLACVPFPQVGEDGAPITAPGLSPSMETYPLSRFSDIPIPSRFKYDRSRSFIYESGSGTIKVGRLFFQGWAGLDSVIGFYQNEMLNNGWTLIRVIEHDGNMLLYEKEARVCTINITSTLGQSTVEIQVGPK